MLDYNKSSKELQWSELYDNKTLKVSILDESRCFTNLRSYIKMGSAPIYAPDRH